MCLYRRTMLYFFSLIKTGGIFWDFRVLLMLIILLGFKFLLVTIYIQDSKSGFDT